MTTRNVEIKVAWLQNPDTSALPELATLAHLAERMYSYGIFGNAASTAQARQEPWHRVVQHDRSAQDQIGSLCDFQVSSTGQLS